MADANIRAVITAQDEASGVIKNFGSNANTQLNAVQETAKHTSSQFENMFKAVVFGNTIFSLATDAARTFKEGLSEANKVADEMQASVAQINQLLITTHDASGQSAESINKMAESIAKTTPISKEATLAAAQMLIPFTNIHKETFPAVLKAADDLATHLNHGLAPNTDQVAQAAKQLGRAFNDPANGMGLLRRAGVSLTHDQQEQIKTMQNQGNLLGAQKLLLQDLSNTMGGSATASAKTFSGQMTIAKNTLIDFGANGIMKLKDDLNLLTQFWLDHSAAIEKVIKQITTFLQPSVVALSNTLKNDLLPSIKRLIDSLSPGVIELLKIMAEIIGGIVITNLRSWIDLINASYKAIATVINIISNLINWLGNLIGAAINAGSSIIHAFSGVAGAIEAPFLAAFRDIKSGIQDVEDTFNRVKHDITSAPGKVTGGVKGALGKVFGFAGGTDYAPGGLAVVGEQGPELVNLPRGSSVTPNNKISGVGGQVNITVQAGAFMGNPQDARQYAKLILSSLQDVASSKGMSLDQLWRHNGIRSI